MSDQVKFSLADVVGNQLYVMAAMEGALQRAYFEIPDQAPGIASILERPEQAVSLAALADVLEQYPDFLNLYRDELAHLQGIRSS